MKTKAKRKQVGYAFSMHNGIGIYSREKNRYIISTLDEEGVIKTEFLDKKETRKRKRKEVIKELGKNYYC